MSCRQTLLLLLALCAWMLLHLQVHSAPSSNPGSPSSSAPPSKNCSRSNSSSSPEQALLEKRQAMVESVRTNLMAKLNMKSPPTSHQGSGSSLSPAQLAKYKNLLKVLELDDGANSPEGRSGCGAQEEITHFSKHLKVYNPETFVPAVNRFENIFGQGEEDEDEKGEEIRESSKARRKRKADKKGSVPAAPLWYNLKFSDLDLSDLDRIWSVQLQLYSRKAEGQHSRRGRNPVENVKIYRVSRTYAYGRWVKFNQLLATKSVPSDRDGYVSVNITEGIREWLRTSSSQETSLDLHIHVDTPQIVTTRQPFSAAIVFDMPNQHGRNQHNAQLLVERLNERERVGANRIPDSLHGRRKRQTMNGIGDEYCLNHPNETNCCVRELTVNFHRDLNWTNVLYPLEFQPNYCNGQCVEPTWPKATDSTRFLMQLRESNPTAAPEPCCVPHKLRSLKIVMKTGVNDNDVEYVEIPNMITDSCICR